MRTVVEEHDVESTVDSAVEKHPRVGAAFDGLVWRIARRPEDGIKLQDGLLVYKQPGIPRQEIPAIRVLYRYSDSTVNILDIDFVY
jgi:hypothetical protein